MKFSNLYFSILPAFLFSMNVLALDEVIDDCKISMKAGEAAERILMNERRSGDLKTIKESLEYFAKRPQLLKKLKPKTSKELLYFVSLPENQKKDYVEKATNTRATAVVAGAVAAAMVAREITPVAKEIAIEKGLTDPKNSEKHTCDETQFDPKS